MFDLRADYGTMDATAAKLSAQSSDLADAAQPVQDACDDAVSAAGQFGPDLTHGSTTFALSWRAATGVFSTSVETLSTNVDTSVITLTGIDDELGATMEPS